MNIHTSSRQAETARERGNVIYDRLLPELKRNGVVEGQFVAINIESGAYVTGATRVDLMSAYKKQFGRTVGWVRRVEYTKDE